MTSQFRREIRMYEVFCAIDNRLQAWEASMTHRVGLMNVLLVKLENRRIA